MTAKDQYCNSNECTINVYVKDEMAPILNLPPNITVPCSYSPTRPEDTGFATAVDNCDGSPTVIYNDFPVSGTPPDQVVFKRTWTAEDNEGNISEDDQFITIPPLLITDAGPDQTIYVDFIGIPGYPYSACATLTASGNGGTPPYTYDWSTGEANASIEVCPDVCTIYEVTITDVNGCVATDEITVFAIIVECMAGNNQNIKYLVCHNNKTICTSFAATEIFLSHGDGLGAYGDLGNDGCAPLEDLADDDEGLRIFKSQSNLSMVEVFPNPTMDNTFFQILAKNDAFGTLTLHDLTSRETIEVYSGFFEKEISHLVKFSTDQVIPGIYLYQFQLKGEEPITGKLIIVK